MRKLSINLNDRLQSIKLLSDVSSILDQLPENDTKYYSYLENTYPYFINLANTFNHNYSDEELLVIANIIYFNKGTTQAIRTFLNYFHVTGDVTYERISISLKSSLINTEITSYSLFMKAFEEFCKDILIINNIDSGVNKIIIDCTIINDISARIETILINTIS